MIRLIGGPFNGCEFKLLEPETRFIELPLPHSRASKWRKREPRIRRKAGMFAVAVYGWSGGESYKWIGLA